MAHDRILTTHVGSLIRPPELIAYFEPMLKGEPYDRQGFEKTLKEAVAEIVVHGSCATFDLHPVRPSRFAEGDLVVETAVL